jgi:hypothetical protein
MADSSGESYQKQGVDLFRRPSSVSDYVCLPYADGESSIWRNRSSNVRLVGQAQQETVPLKTAQR